MLKGCRDVFKIPESNVKPGSMSATRSQPNNRLLSGTAHFIQFVSGENFVDKAIKKIRSRKPNKQIIQPTGLTWCLGNAMRSFQRKEDRSVYSLQFGYFQHLPPVLVPTPGHPQEAQAVAACVPHPDMLQPHPVLLRPHHHSQVQLGGQQF